MRPNLFKSSSSIKIDIGGTGKVLSVFMKLDFVSLRKKWTFGKMIFRCFMTTTKNESKVTGNSKDNLLSKKMNLEDKDRFA